MSPAAQYEGEELRVALDACETAWSFNADKYALLQVEAIVASHKSVVG